MHQSSNPVRCARTSRLVIAVLLLLAFGIESASARIVRTRSASRDGGINLLLGIGAEFEKGEYAVPLLIEWSPNGSMTLVIEPAYGAINGDDEWIRGFKQIDTALIYDFAPAPAGRPGFGLEFGIKFPTASNDQIGSGESDYSIGLIMTKESADHELEFNLIYTLTGDPNDENLDNELEASVAGEWEWTHVNDVIAEVALSHGGGVRQIDSGGNLSLVERSGFDAQVTIGLAQQLMPHLKLEEGITWISGGTWQGQIALEWDFADDD